MGSQNEAKQDTGKPNARAGHRDVVKGAEDRNERTSMRNWKYDGWTELDWHHLTEDSTTLNALAREVDRVIGAGGGGFRPDELQDFQELLEAMANRFKRIRKNYY